MAIFAMISCSTTAAFEEPKTERNEDGFVIEMQNPQTLLDILQRLPGVYTNGNRGANAVTVRGGIPLFVLDGIRLGRGFTAVDGVVNVADISSVELLTSPTETAFYGREGGNGVIIIRTN